VGQRLDALDVDFRPDFPGLAEVVAVEGAQGADGLVEGGTGELAFGLEVDEEVEDLARIEIRERGVRVVVGQLGDPTEVGLDGAAAQPFELDEAEVVLIPISDGDSLAR
jgi:cytosine/adenosine deaminase-related metal-dependent hydrolase